MFTARNEIKKTFAMQEILEIHTRKKGREEKN
jgi:hypothetical protein